MNILLVGAGAIAREHVLALRALQAQPEHRDLRLAGVAAPRPGAAAAFAAEHGLPASTDSFSAALADPTIDAVIICSPSALHAPQTAAALAAGKHVLCEIPLALSLAEGEALARLASQHQRTVMVAHTLRFRPALVAVRDRIARGTLHPTAIIARYTFHRRSNVGWTGRARSWTDNLLWHHGCHAIDTCLWLLGGETAEVVSLVAPPDAELGVPLDFSVVVRTQGGALATVAMSYNSGLALHDYVIVDPASTLLATPEQLTDASGAVLVAAPGDNPIVTQDAAFLAACRGEQPAPVAIPDVLPTLAVLQAIADAAGWQVTAEERAAAATV